MCYGVGEAEVGSDGLRNLIGTHNGVICGVHMLWNVRYVHEMHWIVRQNIIIGFPGKVPSHISVTR